MAAAPLLYPPRSSRMREGGGWQRLPFLPLTDLAEGGRGEGGGGGQRQRWDGGDGEPTTTMTTVVDGARQPCRTYTPIAVYNLLICCFQFVYCGFLVDELGNL